LPAPVPSPRPAPRHRRPLAGLFRRAALRCHRLGTGGTDRA